MVWNPEGGRCLWWYQKSQLIMDDLSFLRIAAALFNHSPKANVNSMGFVYSVLLILDGKYSKYLLFRKENTTIYTLVFARAECRKLLLRVTVCVRRFTVPVGKVFSSSSRCDEASFAVRSSARIENESAAMYCC